MRIFLIIIILVSCSAYKHNSKIKLEEFDFIDYDQISFRAKPILNREYLICLAWHLNVYISFPDKALELIPQYDILDTSRNLDPIDFFKSNIDNKGILHNYVFNSEYLDYPIIGLSDKQYQIVLKWMKDRYNENKCINAGLIEEGAFQIDRESFNTESFLVLMFPQYVRQLK